MAGRLSFSIAINLLTENFRKGSNQVKAAFRSMQMQILTFAAALGAGGIGLSNLVSRFVDVARETNRVTTALKNVSGGMLQYADNQRYLIDLAKKYGLEINALTGNFAKFTAAASVSGMSMTDQRKVFESVSRACTAFGMSADDSNGVMLALSQMMSKGKISSEELRLQMGERLPVAIQAMAKAAGVSVAGLDKLMKKGQVISKDVLPKFAEALNEMIPNVDTDNLETSVNRLKNVFTDLVNSTDAQSRYKTLIDWLTGAVQSAANNIKSIVTYMVAAILVMITSRLVTKIIGSIAKAELYAKVAARRVAKDAGLAFDEVAWKAKKTSAAMQMAFSRAVASIKATLISMAPTAILAAIGAIVAKLYNAYHESKRIKNIFSDYQKNLWSASNTPEITRMQTLVNIMNDRKKSQNEINTAQSELQKMLGKENLSQEELNKLVIKRIALLREAAMAEHAFNTVGEYAEKNARLAGNVGLSTGQMDRLAELRPINGTSDYNSSYYNRVIGDELKKNGNLFKGISLSDVDKALSEYIQNNLVIADATNRAGKHQVNANQLTTTVVDPDDEDKNKIFQKQQESHAKQIAELDAELEIGKISQAQYNKSLGELNVKMYAQAKGTGDKKTLESDYFKNLKIAAEKAIANQDKTAALVELEKVQKDYNTKVKEAEQQHAKGLISQKELNANIASLSVEAAKSAAGIKGIGDGVDVFIAAMQFNAQRLASPIKVKPRDTTYDYKKTKVDIASETLDKAKELAEAYKQRAKEMGQTLEDELANAMANVPNLEDALKIAQVKQDIKDFSKELNEGVYSGMKDIASSADRMVSAWQNIGEVMDNVDSSAWERILAVWNAMTSTIDGFLSIIKTIETITELTDKLAKAKETEAAIDTVTTATKVGNATTEATAEVTALSTQTAAEITLSKAKSTAASTEMAAKSTAAYAYIPFAGVGLAAAQITAMEALIAAASIPKFANGAVVTGRTLAEVGEYPGASNNPEVIAPLSKLKSLLKDSSGGGNTSVTIGFDKVRGSDIFLSIKNYMKSTGKKL